MKKRMEFKVQGFDAKTKSWIDITGFPLLLEDEASAMTRIERSKEQLNTKQFTDYRILRRIIKYETGGWNLYQQPITA